jgi:hypothetical protein
LAIPAPRPGHAFPIGLAGSARPATRAWAAEQRARLESALVGFNWRPLLLPLSLMGALGLAAIWLMPGQGYDAYAYWSVDPLNPYQATAEFGAFRYAPPMALLMAPLGALPFQFAYLAWLGLGLAALWYVAGRWALVLVLFPPVFTDLAFGNVHVLFAAMIVAAWRRPGFWAFALLTKVTPAVGIVWHGVRGEWRSLGTILVVVGVAVGASLAIQGPAVWVAWVDMLGARQDFSSASVVQLPLAPRLLAALALVTWGARTDRRWTVPVALCLAVPTWFLSGLMLAPLIAIVAIWRDRASRRAEPRPDIVDQSVAGLSVAPQAVTA